MIPCWGLFEATSASPITNNSGSGYGRRNRSQNNPGSCFSPLGHRFLESAPLVVTFSRTASDAQSSRCRENTRRCHHRLDTQPSPSTAGIDRHHLVRRRHCRWQLSLAQVRPEAGSDQCRWLDTGCHQAGRRRTPGLPYHYFWRIGRPARPGRQGRVSRRTDYATNRRRVALARRFAPGVYPQGGLGGSTIIRGAVRSGIVSEPRKTETL